MFFETMEEILPDLKVIIESPSGEMQTIYPVEPFNTQTQTQSPAENGGQLQ